MVFVADSQIERMEANIESVENLRVNLAEQGYDLEQDPLRRSSTTSATCPTPSPVEELRRLLNPRNVPEYQAVAPTGVGVFDTLKAVAKLVLTELQEGRPGDFACGARWPSLALCAATARAARSGRAAQPPADAPQRCSPLRPRDAEPAAPKPGAADRRRGFSTRVKTLEEQVVDLKEKIFRTKARLLLLQETVLGGDLSTGARAVIFHRNEMGSPFVLESVAYALDGAPIFTKVDANGDLDKREEFEIFNGRIVPGQPPDRGAAWSTAATASASSATSRATSSSVQSSYTFNAEAGQGHHGEGGRLREGRHHRRPQGPARRSATTSRSPRTPRMKQAAGGAPAPSRQAPRASRRRPSTRASPCASALLAVGRSAARVAPACRRPPGLGASSPAAGRPGRRAGRRTPSDNLARGRDAVRRPRRAHRRGGARRSASPTARSSTCSATTPTASVLFYDLVADKDVPDANARYRRRALLPGGLALPAEELLGARLYLRAAARAARRATTGGAGRATWRSPAALNEFAGIDDVHRPGARALGRRAAARSSTYVYGKWLFRRDGPAARGARCARPREAFRRSPSDPRARYRLAGRLLPRRAATCRRRQLRRGDRAVPRGRRDQARATTREQRRSKELANLSLGRVLFEPGKYDEAIDRYQDDPARERQLPRLALRDRLGAT